MNTVAMYSKRIVPFNGSPGDFGMMHDSTKSPPYMMTSTIMQRLPMMPASPPMMGMSPASSTSTFASPPPHLATPSPQAMHSPEGKNDPPKRLRYWLVDMINSGTIPELRWEDEAKTIFRIPWKHAGKNNWKEEDCRIFKAWAEHRGKYKEGVDKFDPATWKTRLRCALNKLPDIKELRDRSQLEGTDPYRVYQLLPEPDKNDGGMRYESHASVAPYNQYHRQVEGKAPTMEFSQLHVGQDFQKQYEDSKIDIKPPEDIPDSEYDLQDHSIKPLPPIQDHMEPMMPRHNFSDRRDDRRPFVGNQHAMNRDYQMQTTPGLDKSPVGFHGMASPVGSESSQGNPHMEPEPSNYFRHQPPPSQMISNTDASPAPYEMNVYIRYKGMNIMSHHVTNQAGCRIHFGNFGLQQLATVTQELPSHLFGPQNLFQIELVGCEHYSSSEKQINLTNHLLKNVQRGLILSYSPDGTIVAKRLCQSRVFYLSPESTSKEPEKLERNRVTKLFDYSSFCNHLKRYAAEQCPSPPSMEIKMSFGQSWSMKNPLEKNLISVVVVPCAAAFLLQKVRERNATLTSIDNSLQTSGPCSDDILVERVTRDSEECVDELIDRMMNSYGDDDYQYRAFGQTGMQKHPYDHKPQYYQPNDMNMEVQTFKVN